MNWIVIEEDIGAVFTCCILIRAGNKKQMPQCCWCCNARCLSTRCKEWSRRLHPSSCRLFLYSRSRSSNICKPFKISDFKQKKTFICALVTYIEMFLWNDDIVATFGLCRTIIFTRYTFRALRIINLTGRTKPFNNKID